MSKTRLCGTITSRINQLENYKISMSEPAHKPRPLTDLFISILIPSLILMKLSEDEYLGATWALVVALIFPLGWGIWERVTSHKTNFIAVLGLISVILTGGIGLLELDAQWLAVKEAAIPGLIAIGVLISTRTRYPLIRTLLYNPNVMNVDKIHAILEEKGFTTLFETRLAKANYFLSGTFIFSAIMNYVLARWIVTSPSGSPAFNEELGQLTLVSYPMIALPSMLMMLGIFYYLWKTIHGLTGLSLENILPESVQQES